MSGTLIEIPGLEGSLPRISDITSGKIPAFWGAGQDMNTLTPPKPTSWSKPGLLLRRPRVAFVGATWPSGPLTVNRFHILTLNTLSPLSEMTADDIPGVKPPDFVFSQQDTFVGAFANAITLYYYPGFQAIPSPMKYPGVAGQPFVSSDFLYVLVASAFNSHASVNVDQLIAQKPWFPRMAVRIFTPLPPVLLGDASSLIPDAVLQYESIVTVVATWNSAILSAVPVLQEAGIDVQIVGTEADVTIEVVGKLIADHFGFTG